MTDLIEITSGANGIMRIALNRPDKKNALSIALRDAVTAALETAAADASVKTVILSGNGSAFSAGFDLGEFQAAGSDPKLRARIWESSDRYHAALLKFPLPVIAAVNGPAMGGGFDTAVLCDLRIASETARFGHPEVVFGDVVYAPLRELVGGAAARDLCLTGRTVNAAEALKLGLVTSVVPEGALAAAAEETAASIVRAPREILLRTKAKIVARTAIEFRSTLQL